MERTAKFNIGQVVNHQLYGYRGVVYEIDPTFMLTAEWYEQTAKSRPPKNEPWYHVLVDNGIHTTYVAEQNLRAEMDPQPISHPSIDEIFASFWQGRYLLKKNHLQ